MDGDPPLQALRSAVHHYDLVQNGRLPIGRLVECRGMMKDGLEIIKKEYDFYMNFYEKNLSVLPEQGDDEPAEGFGSGDDHWTCRLKKENKELKKESEDLKKENEDLKKDNKELKKENGGAPGDDYIVLCCAIMYYAVLHCTTLYYTILYPYHDDPGDDPDDGPDHDPDDGPDHDPDDDPDDEPDDEPGQEDGDDESLSSDDENMLLYIRMPTGTRTYSISAKKEYTIYRLSAKVSKRSGIPRHQIRLSLDGSQLEDGLVKDYDIPNEATLGLALRLGGGVRAVKKEMFSKSDKMKMAVGMLKAVTANIDQDKADFSKNIKTSIKNLVATVTMNSNIVEKNMKEASNKSILAVLQAFKSNEFNNRVLSIAMVLFQKEFSVLEDMEDLVKNNKEAMKAAAEYIIVAEFMDDSSGMVKNKNIVDIAQKVLMKEETGDASGLEPVFKDMCIDGWLERCSRPLWRNFHVNVEM